MWTTGLIWTLLFKIFFWQCYDLGRRVISLYHGTAPSLDTVCDEYTLLSLWPRRRKTELDTGALFPSCLCLTVHLFFLFKDICWAPHKCKARCSTFTRSTLLNYHSSLGTVMVHIYYDIETNAQRVNSLTRGLTTGKPIAAGCTCTPANPGCPISSMSHFSRDSYLGLPVHFTGPKIPNGIHMKRIHKEVIYTQD